MRGKVTIAGYEVDVKGITPAYAGKREGPKNAQSKVGDHPRVCGEKCIPLTRGHGRQGSPPRMRGKVQLGEIDLQDIWITPAYAGKSGPCPDRVPPAGDHPRVCGEKHVDALGSVCRLGITPAYAGKSDSYTLPRPLWRDHPRVCGEKKKGGSPEKSGLGSPPRMRGKEFRVETCFPDNGITPAYAGKRMWKS